MNEKTGLHPRNKHKSSYDFKELTKSHPPLAPFVGKNKFDVESIDFSQPLAVTALNTALLKHFYGIDFWEIPKGYLCPPIPGRADYIHQVADLLGPHSQKTTTSILDIGVGANCIYPLIACKEYQWKVTGSDTDVLAVKNAEKIVQENHLGDMIDIRHQPDENSFFANIIKETEFFDAVISNPPFHSSLEEARLGSEKKNRNLKIKFNNSNFGGKNNELWCEGGEQAFITKMIQESAHYQKNCKWFTSLVSKSTTLPHLYAELKKIHVTSFKTIDMAQGQKKSRFIAWTFNR